MPSYCCVVGCKNGCRGQAQASRDEIANVRKLSSVPIGEQMIPEKLHITIHLKMRGYLSYGQRVL